MFRKELIESLPGVFYMIDGQGRFLMWNHNLEQVLQLSPEEMAASHPLDFFEGEDKANIEKTIHQVFSSGEDSAEAELISKDGTRTPYHFTGRRVTRDGEPVLIGMGLDITGQRDEFARSGNTAAAQSGADAEFDGRHPCAGHRRQRAGSRTMPSAVCWAIRGTRLLRMNVTDWDDKVPCGRTARKLSGRTSARAE